MAQLPAARHQIPRHDWCAVAEADRIGDVVAMIEEEGFYAGDAWCKAARERGVAVGLRAPDTIANRAMWGGGGAAREAGR